VGIRADDRAGNDAVVHITSSEFFMVAQAAKAAGGDLAKNMRREMRLVAGPILSKVRSEIALIPSSGKYRGGIRAALQRGTTASVSMASARSAGIRIQTNPRYLPEAKRPLAKAFNAEKGFRHPVFANPDHMRNNRTRAFKRWEKERKAQGQDAQSWTWVHQQGRPYFGAVIADYYDDVAAGLRKAVDDTAMAIARAKGRA